VQVARDFGISENTVQHLVNQVNIDDGLVGGAASVKQAELVALRRRVRVFEQEVKILRRATAYFARDTATKGRSRWSVTLPSRDFP
jgi:transposase